MDTKWRSTLVKLVVLELALFVVFFVLGHIIGNAYFRGVGIGLLISWGLILHARPYCGDDPP